MQHGFSKEIPFGFHLEAVTDENLLGFETPSEQEERWIKEEQRRCQGRRVEAVLPKLSPKQEMAVRLFLMGCSYREIAVKMRVNVRTAWEYLRGRKGIHGGAIRRIQKLLEEGHGERNAMPPHNGGIQRLPNRKAR